MPPSLLYWILMLLWLLGGIYVRWPATGSPTWPALIPDLVLFLLLLILGWHDFGPPIRF